MVEKPITLFSGVRNSCDARERNSVLERLARSASSFASSRALSQRRRSLMSVTDPTVPTTVPLPSW